MLIKTLRDGIELVQRESQLTQQLLNELTDDSLKQPISLEDRTLGRIAWHMTTSILEMVGRTGLKIEYSLQRDELPQSAREIAEHYSNVIQALLSAMESQWNDQSLLEEKNMYGEAWTIGETLQGLVVHDIHHRGQISVLMRQAGLKMPPIYGPARENWASMGMKAPLV